MAKQITKLEQTRLYERKAELERMLDEAREKLNIAKGHGDLSENAEFDTAKAEVETLTDALKQISIKLKAEVVDSWTFRLKPIGATDIPDAEFEVELGTVDTSPFDFSSSDRRGIVTRSSKLGTELLRYLELRDKNRAVSTIGYIDNKQIKRTFEVISARNSSEV